MDIRYIGKDADNIPRVWGEGETEDIAQTRCWEAVMDYCRRKRNVPLTDFTVEADA